MRSLIKGITPPVVVDVMRMVLEKRVKEYQTFDDAIADSSPDGYQFDRLIQVVFEKAKRYVKNLNSQTSFIVDTTTANLILAALSAAKDGELNVIDFGGGCGISYHQVKKALTRPLKINWRVVETSNMVKVAKNLSDDELLFFSDLSEAVQSLNRVDLFYSSGTLQYLPNPMTGLKEWLAVGASHLYLTRLSLTSEPKQVIIAQQSWFHENGVGPLPEGMTDEMVKYPHTILPKTMLLDELQKRYQIRLLLDEKPGIPKANDHKLEGLAVLAIKT